MSCRAPRPKTEPHPTTRNVPLIRDMAYQMVYTSVRSGLVAGRSGFCTAARHREIKESLVARLEDFSAQYDRSVAIGGELPVIYQHRIVTIRENRYHVLMRLADAGNDYTGRTNHIAHSLVLEPAEVAGLSLTPAEAILALAHRGFWRNRYDEPARFFGSEETIDLSTLPRSASLPSVRWHERSGAAANAAQLFDSNGPTEAGVVVSGNGESQGFELLALFAESLLLLGPDRSVPDALWSVPFTTVLQSTAERSQFRWCGIVQGSNLETQESRAGRRVVTPGSPMTPPNTIFSDLAEGRPSRNAPNPRQELETLTSAPNVEPDRTLPVQHDPATAPGRNTPILQESGTPTGYYVPISLDDPKRAKRAAKRSATPAWKASLIGSGVVLLLAAVVLAVWLGKKDVWAEEARIGRMVENDDWKKIHNEFQTQEASSEKLRTWKAAAKAISRYQEIATTPRAFPKTVAGKRTVNEALAAITQDWENEKLNSPAQIQKKVETERTVAEENAKIWSTADQQLRETLETLSRANSEYVKVQANVLLSNLGSLDESMKRETLESITSVERTISHLSKTILPSLEEVEKIDRIYKHDEALDDSIKRAKASADNLNSIVPKIKSEKNHNGFHDKVLTVSQTLIKKFEALSEPKGYRKETPPLAVTPTPPTPNPAIAATVAPKKEKPLPPPTVLIATDPGEEITLSGFVTSSQDGSNKFEIFPLSSLFNNVGVEATSVTVSGKKGRDRNRNVVFKQIDGSKLAKEGNHEFWKAFPGGFLMRSPVEPTKPIQNQYLVLDPVSTASPPWTTLPVDDFLTRSTSGEVILSGRVTKILEQLRPPGDGLGQQTLKFQLSLRGEFPVSIEPSSDAASLKLPVVSSIEENVSSLKEDLKNHLQASEASQAFHQKYANLGKDLFPQFFKENAPVGSGGGPDKQNPRGSSIKPTVTPTFAEFGAKPFPRDKFSEYVKTLFKSLDQLAGDSQDYKTLHGYIEKFILRPSQIAPRDGLPKEAVGWIELTKTWSATSSQTGPMSPAKVDPKDQEAIQIQNQYFKDFQRVWNERFNENAATKFANHLTSNAHSQTIDPTKLESEINRLSEIKIRLESPSLEDDGGEYSLDLILEEPNPVSPNPIRHVIPLIKNVPSR